MALTNTEVLKAKPGPTPVKMADGRGLYLLITPAGSKLWRWKYRFLGKEKLMAVGAYPDVSLAQARDKVDEARKQLATGADPMAARKFEKIARRLAVEDTFAAVAKKWWESWKAARSDSHTVYVWRRLEADVFPAIGLRPVAEIEAPELVAMMKAIEKRGALDIAKRALQTCSQIFRYAIAHGLAKRNPAVEIRPSDVLASRKKQNYARLDSKELPELLRKMEVYNGSAITRVAIKLMAMTFVRTTLPLQLAAKLGHVRKDFGSRCHVDTPSHCALPCGARRQELWTAGVYSGLRHTVAGDTRNVAEFRNFGALSNPLNQLVQQQR